MNHNATSTDAWLTTVVGKKSSTPADDRGGVDREEQEGSRTGEVGLDSAANSDSGVPAEVETVLQDEPFTEGVSGAVSGRHGENDPAHDGDKGSSSIHNGRDMDESGGTSGGVGSASGGVERCSLEDVVRGRRKLDGLLDWLNANRAEWANDAEKSIAFRSRENHAIYLAEIQDRNEKKIAFSMLLSPDALGVLLETYNLPEDK